MPSLCKLSKLGMFRRSPSVLSSLSARKPSTAMNSTLRMAFGSGLLDASSSAGAGPKLGILNATGGVSPSGEQEQPARQIASSATRGRKPTLRKPNIAGSSKILQHHTLGVSNSFGRAARAEQSAPERTARG